MENCLENARLLSKSLEATGWYTCVSDIHRKKGEHTFSGIKQVFGNDKETSADYNAGLPVVAFRFSDEFKKEFPHLKQDTISNLLRAKQYIIPNYPLPPTEENIEILRVVVRESMSFDLMDRLITDICQTTQNLIDSDEQDLSILHLSKDTSAEKAHSITGTQHRGKSSHGKIGKHPLTKGVHRSVC
jgi:glutamate decarboxylase